MASSYLDALLKLVLRVFSGGSLVGNVGGGSTGLNFNAPITAVLNTQNVDVGLAPIPLGSAVTGVLPAAQMQTWADPGVVYAASFTAVACAMHPFAFTATAAINFPKITAAIDGQPIALINLGTGATASTLFPSGTDSMGAVAQGVTGATAAGPSSLKAQRYTPCLTTGQWTPGI